MDGRLSLGDEEVVLLFDVDVELDAAAADQLVLAESRVGDDMIGGAQTREFNRAPA